MFGWLKREKASAQAPQIDRPKTDQNGRAILPDLALVRRVDADYGPQAMLALQWASDWCEYQGEVTKEWLPRLEDVLAGRREKGIKKGEREDEARVVKMAARALRLEDQRLKAERTKGAFPWAQFRLGPVDMGNKFDCPCKLALAMDKQITPWNAFPVLPLPGCDAHVCKCWFRQVTKAEAAKAGIKT